MGHYRTHFRTPYQDEKRTQGDRTGDSLNRQPSYQKTQLPKKKKKKKKKRRRRRRRKNKWKAQNVGKVLQREIYRQKPWKPVSSSATQFKSVEADPSCSETGPQTPLERTI